MNRKDDLAPVCGRPCVNVDLQVLERIDLGEGDESDGISRTATKLSHHFGTYAGAQVTRLACCVRRPTNNSNALDPHPKN